MVVTVKNFFDQGQLLAYGIIGNIILVAYLGYSSLVQRTVGKLFHFGWKLNTRGYSIWL